MAIINQLRFVDALRERLGEEVSRNFAQVLQDEATPLATKEEVQLMISGLVEQFEARMWRVVAVATGIQLTAIGIAAAVIIALN